MSDVETNSELQMQQFNPLFFRVVQKLAAQEGVTVEPGDVQITFEKRSYDSQLSIVFSDKVPENAKILRADPTSLLIDYGLTIRLNGPDLDKKGYNSAVVSGNEQDMSRLIRDTMVHLRNADKNLSEARAR